MTSIKNVFSSKALSDIEKETKALKHVTVGEWHKFINQLYNEIKKFNYYEPNYIKQLVYNITNNILSNILSDNTISDKDVYKRQLLHMPMRLTTISMTIYSR